MDMTERDGRVLATRATPASTGGVRIGDGDRAAADRVLGDHVTAGRLNSTEYAERAAQAQAARVRGDITALFEDLPAPHPRFDDPVVPEPAPAPPAQPATSSAAPPSPQNRRLRHAAVAVLGPCAVVGAVSGSLLAASTPVLYLLALAVVAGIYGLLVLVDNRRATGGR